MIRATALSARFGYMFKDKHPLPQGASRMKFRYVTEHKDGKLIDSAYESVDFGPDDDWSAKTVPARDLPNGGRTIRPE